MNKLRKILKQKGEKGLTLVEIMVTILILSFGILGSMLHFANATGATELARDMTTATTHAEYILEDMKAMATLAAITGTNWTTRSGTLGLNTLKSESISVAYVDAAADPLNATVTVSWQTRGRTHTISLTTEMTK